MNYVQNISSVYYIVPLSEAWCALLEF